MSSLHIRYTAREAGDPLGSTATKELKKIFADAKQSPQALILNLKYDFPTEWAAFVNGAGQQPFTAKIDRSFLPYYVQSMTKVTILGGIRACCAQANEALATTSAPGATTIVGNFLDPVGAVLTLPPDALRDVEG